MKRYLRGKKLQSGEIATIIAIGTLVIIGATSLFSSVFLGKKQSTSSKASTACTKGQTSDQGCAAYGCPKGSKRICTCLGTDWSQSSCECKADASCPGADTGSGGAGDGGTVTCNEGYYCEGNDCFKKLKSCGRDGPLEKSFCAGQSCGPQQSGGNPSQGAGGAEPSQNPQPSQPPGAGGGEVSWGEWDLAAAKCGSDAGCICGKMGKGFCNPGNCRSEAGNVCVPNKWGDKSSWGCWGPPIQQCAVQPSPTPKASSGTDCTPGTGSFGNDNKYFCCFKAGEGERKLPYPHYEEQGGKVDCAAKTGVGQPPEKEKPPANCGPNSFKVTRPDFCGQSSEDANYTYEQGGWCCEPKTTTGTSTSSQVGCDSVSCPPNYTGGPYYSGSKNGTPLGFFKSQPCTGTPDLPGVATTDQQVAKFCSKQTGQPCTDSDYERLADSGKCGGDDGSCGKNQKKYTKASNNTCSGSNSKCKDNLLCGALSNGELTIPCNPVQCDSGRTGVYQRGVNYFFNERCDGLPVATNKANACGPSTENLSCAFATRAGCWFTNCGPISASMRVQYTCQQDLAGWGYCCPPGKLPPNSGQGFVTTGQGFTFSAGSQTAIDFGDLSCYQSSNDTYVCKPK